MGEGTNVQKRLVALHHLDAPWRPADIEQREGRILRQGNQNEYVKIFRYVTEGSFDAYMWQTLETKCRFIAQVMNGDATVRRAEDVDAAALTYAEVKAIASGNPLVIEKATIDAEVMRLTRLKKQHAESLYQMRYRIRATWPTTSQMLRARDCQYSRRPAHADEHTRRQFFDDREERNVHRSREGRSRARLPRRRDEAIRIHEDHRQHRRISRSPLSRFDERANLIIHGKREYKANVSDSPTGTIASLEHALDSIEDRLREREADLTAISPAKRRSHQATRPSFRARGKARRPRRSVSRRSLRLWISRKTRRLLALTKEPKRGRRRFRRNQTRFEMRAPHQPELYRYEIPVVLFAGQHDDTPF